MWVKKNWPALLAIALQAESLWKFLKSAMDWRGRYDALAETYHEIGGASVVLGYILDPPPLFYPLAFFAGLILIWWNFHRNRPNVHIHHAIPTPTPTQPPTPKPKKVFVNVSPSYLVGLYKNRTQVQGDEYVAAYIGKWIPVTGTVCDIRTTVTGTLYVQIVDNDKIFISATLNEESPETISHIARGAAITVRGEIYLVNESGVMLRTCELDETSPS
jgi:tRNA_anti-like